MSFRDSLNNEGFEVFKHGGFGERMGYGNSPALLVVDMTYAFVDSSYDKGVGDPGWKAVRFIKVLLEEARRQSIPVIYTVPMPDTPEYLGYKFRISRKSLPKVEQSGLEMNRIVEEIKPIEPSELVITKMRASAFFGTNLPSVLTYYGVDTVIVTGVVTSGCIRATVVDAASYGYYVIVPEEAVADRVKLCHDVSLLDMDMKYADVVSVNEVKQYFSQLSLKR